MNQWTAEHKAMVVPCPQKKTLIDWQIILPGNHGSIWGCGESLLAQSNYRHCLRHFLLSLPFSAPYCDSLCGSPSCFCHLLSWMAIHQQWVVQVSCDMFWECTHVHTKWSASNVTRVKRHHLYILSLPPATVNGNKKGIISKRRSPLMLLATCCFMRNWSPWIPTRRYYRTLQRKSQDLGSIQI